MGNVNPFSLEDDSLKRRGREPQRSGFPRMQVSSYSSRFYVKTTRGGGGRRFLRDPYSNSGEFTQPVIKSKFIFRGSDSTRHLIHHIDYMMKSKIDREREPEIRKLFDRDGNQITRDEGIKKALANQTYNIAGHKLILSPGDNAVDLVGYTRDQMKVLEERFNARIDYTFSYQKNTDHYHIHVNLPAKAERRLDLAAGGEIDRVDIRLDRNDFAAMRTAGKKFLRDYTFVDHLTDANVQRDLLCDWYTEERNEEKNYNRQMRKDLGLEMTQADVRALKELGIDIQAVLKERGIVVPIRNWQPGQLSQKNKQEPYLEKDGVIKDELTRYLLDRSADFDSSWSDKDVARILQTSERDPEWVFPAAYSAHKQEKEKRSSVIEKLKSDERFQDFVKGLEISLDLKEADRAAERLKSGHTKGEFASPHAKIDDFFQTASGTLIYEKVADVQKSLELGDGKDRELFVELDHLMDRHIDRDSKQLLEKYNLRAPQADEKAAREIGEDTTDLVIQRSSEIKRMMRTLNYKSSGTFVDSFERLIELQEGPDALGKPKTVDERNYLLAERLIQPEYAEEREHFGHIQERAFQLHSRFSDGERSQSNAGAIRNSQFALDTKVFELDKERFPDDIERSVGKHERNADAYALNYLEAVKNGDEKEAAIEARKYHASVMKVDDDRRRDENAISVDCERTNKEEKELPAGDPRQVTELERGDDVTIEFEGGAYLPLPGYGLERLERDSGDLMSDPSDIQIELTSDELRRRRDDDEHEEGRQL